MVGDYIWGLLNRDTFIVAAARVGSNSAPLLTFVFNALLLNAATNLKIKSKWMNVFDHFLSKL